MHLQLTNLIHVKTLLEITDTETRFDELLAQLINSVSHEIETFLNRKLIVASNIIETFDVQTAYYQKFSIEAYPITSVTDIRHDWGRTFATSTIIAAGDYYTNKSLGIICIDKFPLTPGKGVLQVTYSGGMASSTSGFMSAFPDLTAAATLEVVARFQRKSTYGLIAITASGGSATIAQRNEFLPAVEQVLDRYRRIGATI
jgi:hypothetical protein